MLGRTTCPAVHIQDQWLEQTAVAMGVLGTLETLFRSQKLGALANLSPMLGKRVRTNSEAITAVLTRDKTLDLSQGPATSSDFHANQYTHITQNRVRPATGL